MSQPETRNLENRIDSLQGELSTATWAIAQLLKMLFAVLGDAKSRTIFRERILSLNPPAGVNESWRDGSDAFAERIEKYLSDPLPED